MFYGGLRTALLFWGILSVFPCAHAEQERAPRHWNLMFETLHEMRTVLEVVESGGQPEPAQLESIKSSVQILTRYEDSSRLVDYLIGAGKGQAGPFLVDYQVVSLYASTGKNEKLIRALGFDELREGLGFAENATPQRKHFLETLKKEMARVEAILEPADKVFAAQNDLKAGTKRMEYVAFITMLIAGLGMGDLAYQNVHLFGLNHIPLERVAASIGAGISTTVGGFNTLWPRVQEWFSKTFLRSRYHRLIDASVRLLEFDLDTSLPRVTEMARPTGAVVQAQEDAALDALFTVKNPAVTEALFEVAVDSLEKGYTKRADKVFREIVQREQESHLGRLAATARDAIAGKKAFEKEIFRFKRNHATWFVAGSALALGATLAGIWFLRPDTLSLWQAAVFQGIGIAGARALFYRLWPGAPEEKLKKHMEPAQKHFAESLTEMLREGQKAKVGYRDEFDPRRVAIDVVVALAKYQNTGDYGKFLRHGAREALQQFNDDIAMSFLIMEAQNRILDEAIGRREPADKVKDVLTKMSEHTTNCLKQLSALK
jgi:hypothetical protein